MVQTDGQTESVRRDSRHFDICSWVMENSLYLQAIGKGGELDLGDQFCHALGEVGVFDGDLLFDPIAILTTRSDVAAEIWNVDLLVLEQDVQFIQFRFAQCQVYAPLGL